MEAFKDSYHMGRMVQSMLYRLRLYIARLDIFKLLLSVRSYRVIKYRRVYIQ